MVLLRLKDIAFAQLARAVFPAGKLQKIIDQLTKDADQLVRVCDFAEKELQQISRQRVETIGTEVTEARVEAAIEAAAAEEERRLNEARWKHSHEQQQKATQHLEELLAKQELLKRQIEEQNASRIRHERGESSASVKTVLEGLNYG